MLSKLLRGLRFWNAPEFAGPPPLDGCLVSADFLNLLGPFLDLNLIHRWYHLFLTYPADVITELMESPADAVGEGSSELSWAPARGTSLVSWTLVSAVLSHTPAELVPTFRELCCLISFITSSQSWVQVLSLGSLYPPTT